MEPLLDMTRLLDVSYLRTLNVEPHYFGLGFIQIKLTERYRLHIWVPDWPVAEGSEGELHDHRYEFKSRILKGRIRHEMFAFLPEIGGPVELAEVSCSPDTPMAPRVLRHGRLEPAGIFTLGEGDDYSLPPDIFHRAVAEVPTVTLVERDLPRKDFARIVRVPGTEAACPFSLKFSQQEIWAKIEEIIGPAPGYHRASISRGVLGEASKIEEEVAEFMDAVQQKVAIMALVELSDLMGAVEAYLRKHHPSLSLGDLIAMKDVTQRAFVNGRRR